MIEIDAEEMYQLLEEDMELGMEVVVNSAEAILKKLDNVDIISLGEDIISVYVLCKTITYMYDTYIETTPKSKLH